MTTRRVMMLVRIHSAQTRRCMVRVFRVYITLGGCIKKGPFDFRMISASKRGLYFRLRTQSGTGIPAANGWTSRRGRRNLNGWWADSATFLRRNFEILRLGTHLEIFDAHRAQLPGELVLSVLLPIVQL